MMLAQEKMGVGQGLGPAGMAGMYMVLRIIYRYFIPITGVTLETDVTELQRIQ